MNVRITVAAVGILAFALTQANAQTFPTKPIRIVVGFTVGSTDLSIRVAAPEMTKRLGQPVVVENMPGANGTIAGNAVVKAAADGYTLYYGPASAISPLFNKNGGVDVGKYLAPVSNFASAPYIFYANAKLPAGSIRELVAWSKSNPGKLFLGSGAVNTAILGAVLKARTGLNYENIFYKGSGPIVAALINGEVGLTATISSGSFASQVRAGAIRPLFVTKKTRSTLFPNLPTAAEFGIPNLFAGTILGLWAPLSTPKDIIQGLSAAAAAAIKTPAISEKLKGEAIAVEPDGSSPEELLDLYNQEITFWSEAARLAKYKPE